MKDYYSLEERKEFYRNIKFNLKSSKVQKQNASKRLKALKTYRPKVFKGSLKHKQNNYGTIEEALIFFKKKKHLWDFIKNKPKMVMKHHKIHDEEIKRLKLFRHNHKLSMKDKIYF